MKHLTMRKKVQRAIDWKPTVERRDTDPTKQVSLKKKKKAYLTIEITYHHPAIKQYTCRYLCTCNSITQQIFLNHQLCAKNPVGHKSVDSDSKCLEREDYVTYNIFTKAEAHVI